jgi:hypothetical protein
MHRFFPVVGCSLQGGICWWRRRKHRGRLGCDCCRLSQPSFEVVRLSTGCRAATTPLWSVLLPAQLCVTAAAAAAAATATAVAAAADPATAIARADPAAACCALDTWRDLLLCTSRSHAVPRSSEAASGIRPMHSKCGFVVCARRLLRPRGCKRIHVLHRSTQPFRLSVCWVGASRPGLGTGQSAEVAETVPRV